MSLRVDLAHKCTEQKVAARMTSLLADVKALHSIIACITRLMAREKHDRRLWWSCAKLCVCAVEAARGAEAGSQKCRVALIDLVGDGGGDVLGHGLAYGLAYIKPTRLSMSSMVCSAAARNASPRRRAQAS
jgi:hypothetical protein